MSSWNKCEGGGGAFDHVVNIQDTWIVNVKDAAVTLHLLFISRRPGYC